MGVFYGIKTHGSFFVERTVSSCGRNCGYAGSGAEQLDQLVVYNDISVYGPALVADDPKDHNWNGFGDAVYNCLGCALCFGRYGSQLWISVILLPEKSNHV